MATITMTLTGVLHYAGISGSSVTTADIILKTDKKTSEFFIALDENAKKICKYRLGLTDFSLHKKMYQPTEIIAQITITPADGDDKDNRSISRKVLEKMFKHARVAVTEDNFDVGKKYYVFEVLPQYFKKTMIVTLKIYSIDKLMTLKETSRTFVGKRLAADILEKEIVNYVEPDTMVLSATWEDKFNTLNNINIEWEKDKDKREAAKAGDDADEYEDAIKQENDHKKKVEPLERDLKDIPKYTGKAISVNTKHMKKLVYMDNTGDNSNSNGQKCEHIHQYLVQYNESFYDMLVRTCNRWGEFMYYEDGELYLGYNDEVIPIEVANSGFDAISFYNLNTKEVATSQKGKYELEADNSSLRGFTLEESPFIPKGQFGYFDERHKGDKWIMKQFPTIFKNDKNLPTLLTNMLFDNLFSLAMSESTTHTLNSDSDNKYFSDFSSESLEIKQHYGKKDFANTKKEEPKREKKAYQEFSELYTSYDEKGYSKVLQKELSVGEDAIHIDYGIHSPKLKLGNIITYNQENFIVVEIKAHVDAEKGPVYEVVATAQDTSEKGYVFYPAVIPAGHVRYANPQEATITDANDPAGFNRVRVMFSWQKEYIRYKDDMNKPQGCEDDTVNASTPWLTFASNQQGAPVTGYHYVGYPVMVGFVDGNVERPYVMGGISDDFFIADSILQTEGGQKLVLNDGWGNGMTAFLAGAFSPLLKTITGFVPGKFGWDWKKSRRFEGGFELSDYYGIYKVSGSTDGRNVSISSPWGDVKINSFTGINISAPNGDVKISGKNVTIEAGNNLKLVSGTNVNYKLWKSKDTKGGTVAQMLLDVTAQVTKKLADIALSIIDLSLVRSTVEIFFRPVEGALTVKSHRFLKLEAGNSSCRYPETAYNQKKKRELLDKINKKTILKTAKLGPGMVEVFNAIKPASVRIVNDFVNNYNACVNDLIAFNQAITALQALTIDPTAIPCKTFEEMKNDLLGQEKDVKWTEDKLSFKDSVAINGDAKNIISAKDANIISGRNHIVGDYKGQAKEIVARRKKARTDVLKKLNTLRKSIFRLTHPVQKTDIDILFGHHRSNEMPNDYKKKLLNAFSKEKCPNAYCYKLSDDEKKFEAEKPRSTVGLVNEKVYMRRLVALNLLEEFGFTDDTRKKISSKPLPLAPIPPAPPILPIKPTVDAIDPNNSINIMNNVHWSNYLDSLSGVPPIGKDLTSAGATILKSLTDSFEEKIIDNFTLGGIFSERKTWGEGQNGQILFGSGRSTYALKNNQFDEVKGIAPTFKSMNNGTKVLDSTEQQSLEKFVDQIRQCLKKF